MTDYTTLKVPELKKLLTDRSLPSTGNKPDLIARLQEDDKKKTGGSAPAAAADDEIDWDEDEKPTTEPAAAAVAAGGQGAVSNPVAVPNQTLGEDPAKSQDLTVKGGADAPVAADGVVAAAGETSAAAPATATTSAEEAKAEESKVEAAPAVDFSIGIQQSDAEKEAAKRAARAKRFGLSVSEEETKKAERAKKFGLEEKKEIVKGLDDALPERRAKRGREGREGRDGGRDAKRQATNGGGRDGRDGRNAGRGAERKPVENKPQAKPAKPAGRVVDDPAEKAKAEARAKRFAAAS